MQKKERAGAGGVSCESIDAAEAASRSCVEQKGKETPSWASPISSSVVDCTEKEIAIWQCPICRRA